MTEAITVKTPAEEPVSARAVSWLLGGSTVLAGAVLVGAILPAEFGVDLLGIGSATGLTALHRPEPLARPSPGGGSQTPATSWQKAPWRSLTLSIPLAAGGDLARKDEVEYKVAMKPGQTIVYAWTAGADVPDDSFYSDFHGHTVQPGRPDGDATSYREGMGKTGNGSLVAGFDGVHGWYFQNQADHPVTVSLTIAGFFEPVAPGQPGNEHGLVARISR